jgi:hypothetical protein
MSGDWLFRREDLDLGEYLRQLDAEIEPHIRQHVNKGDLVKTDEEIADRQMVQAIVGGLNVDFDNPTKEVVEQRVVVFDGYGGRFEVDGVCATRSFRFTGDRGLFERRPTSVASSIRGEIRGNSIIIAAEGQKEDAARLKQQLDSQETTLRECVAKSAAQVETHNEALKAKIMQAVAKRRKHLGELDTLKDRI